MATVHIYEDELYPYYGLDDDYGQEVDVDIATLRRWRRGFKQFETLQDELAEVVGK